ncbi:ImmA/IrrE family metallo-endopeptidase [bacterium]|nr:ImmA/IrrE family metallo-endopeptidase [bacterium]
MLSTIPLNSLIDEFILKMRRGNKKHIKILMCEIADSLRKQAGQNRIPINLNEILELRKVNDLILEKSRFNFQGELIPKREGFSVILNSEHNQTRKRTTLAHEIGHTLFFDISVMPPKRMITYSKSEEWLCYDFGRCLLMPSEFVKKYVSIYKQTPTPQKIIDLTNLFEVSKNVLLMRITRDFQLWKDTTIFLVEVNKNKLKVNKQSSHKGTRHTFTIDGKNGLIHHEKIKSFIQLLQINQKIQEIDETFSFKNNSYRIEMFRYSSNPVSILCIIRDLNDESIYFENEMTSNYIVNSNQEIVEKVQTTLEDYN